MRQNIAVITGACLLFLLYLGGCEKSTMTTQPDQTRPVAQQDQATMGSIIAQDPLFTTDATALSDAVPSLAKTDADNRSGWVGTKNSIHITHCYVQPGK